MSLIPQLDAGEFELVMHTGQQQLDCITAYEFLPMSNILYQSSSKLKRRPECNSQPTLKIEGCVFTDRLLRESSLFASADFRDCHHSVARKCSGMDYSKGVSAVR